jgi:hypothetical protein
MNVGTYVIVLGGTIISDHFISRTDAISEVEDNIEDRSKLIRFALIKQHSQDGKVIRETLVQQDKLQILLYEEFLKMGAA